MALGNPDFNDKVRRILSVKGQCLEIFIIVSIQLPYLFGVTVNPLLGSGGGGGGWPVCVIYN
jgi:hypothetical protein